MAKEPTLGRRGRPDESRQARVQRICAEVRDGRYQVDGERLCLCILAESMKVVAAQLSGRAPHAQRTGC
jgi:anti-sigma28 factor (negative regulator of flagellin synthesis)